MDLPPIPAPLLALLDESRDLARRMVQAAETAADAASLSALLTYRNDPITYRNDPITADATQAARAINRAAVNALARRLAARSGAEMPDRVPPFPGKEDQ